MRCRALATLSFFSTYTGETKGGFDAVTGGIVCVPQAQRTAPTARHGDVRPRPRTNPRRDQRPVDGGAARLGARSGAAGDAHLAEDAAARLPRSGGCVVRRRADGVPVQRAASPDDVRDADP